MAKTIAFVDCDTLVYSSAAVCETRSIKATHLKSGKTKDFKNKTELKAFLKGTAFEFKDEDYSIEEVQVPELEQNAFHIIKNRLKRIREEVNADELHLFVAGSGNHRDDLLLPTRYKANREGTVRPLLLTKVRDFIKKHEGAIAVDGIEVDEVIVYKGYEELAKGNKAIMVSADKDALQYSGLYFYDYTKAFSDVELIPDLGELHWDADQKKVKGSGFLWYCIQQTLGDNCDGYVPYKLSKARYGHKTAFETFKDFKDHKEALTKVIDLYKTWYPTEFEYTAWDGSIVKSDYKQMLCIYHKCSRMMTVENELPNFIKFASQYGVEL